MISVIFAGIVTIVIVSPVAGFIVTYKYLYPDKPLIGSNKVYKVGVEQDTVGIEEVTIGVEQDNNIIFFNNYIRIQQDNNIGIEQDNNIGIEQDNNIGIEQDNNIGVDKIMFEFEEVNIGIE
jgi:hypothetical protein